MAFLSKLQKLWFPFKLGDEALLVGEGQAAINDRQFSSHIIEFPEHSGKSVAIFCAARQGSAPILGADCDRMLTCSNPRQLLTARLEQSNRPPPLDFAAPARPKGLAYGRYAGSARVGVLSMPNTWDMHTRPTSACQAAGAIAPRVPPRRHAQCHWTPLSVGIYRQSPTVDSPG